MIQDETSNGPRPGGRHADQALPSLDGSPQRGLAPQTQKRIGNHLRAMYDQIVQQPIPDRFRDLIDRLDDEPSPDPGARN